MLKAVRIIKNENGEYNLKFLRDGTWNFLYSQQKIRDNVKKEIESINLQDEKIVILIGVGLGYHLIDLINLKLRGKDTTVIAIEPIELIAAAANKLFNLNKTFKTMSNVHYLYGTEEEISFKLTDIVKRLHVVIKKSKFIVPDIYIKFFKDDVQQYLKIINAKTIANALKVGNSIDDTILGIYNMFRNTEAITKSLPLNLLKGYYKNFPAVIVSAGPSLDKNIQYLKKYQDRVLIISTDATFRTLLNLNIRVDFVGVLERDYITYQKFFNNINYDKIPTLIYQAVAWPDIPSNFKNIKIVTFKKGLPTEDKYSEYLGKDYKSLKSGTSVATMLMSFSHFIGVNPIILIGQDLAYSQDGYTHAKNVSVRKKVIMKDTIELEGINNQKVKSTVTWRNFKLELEELIRKNNLNVIDATEGGALIRGTKIEKLINVLNNLAKIKINYGFKKNAINTKELYNNIVEYKKILSKEIIKSISILQNLKNINTDDWDKFIKEYSRVEKCFYFPHFHGLHSRLIINYHYNEEKEKIYTLLNNMIESSKLLLDYIDKGFNIGKNYFYLAKKYSPTISGDYKLDIEKIDFFLKYSFPYKAISLLREMEQKYPKHINEIYKIYMKIYSNFVIEKTNSYNKVLYYATLVLNNNAQYKNDNEILSMINNALNLFLEDLIKLKNFGRIDLKQFHIGLNNVLNLLLGINNQPKQCEILEYFEAPYESFEYHIAKYNCLVHKKKMNEAYNYLIKLINKYPKNKLLYNELKKYKHNNKNLNH